MLRLPQLKKQPIAPEPEGDESDAFYYVQPPPEPFWRRLLSTSARTTLQRLPPWLTIGGSLMLGGVLGALAMRQYRNRDEIVVAYKGGVVTATELHHRLETMAGSEALNALVTEKLALEYARRRKLLPSEAEVKTRMQRIAAQPGFGRIAQQHGYTDADIRAAAQNSLTYEKLFGSAEVTEAEVRDYYRQQTDPRNPSAKFYTPETAKLATFVTSVESRAREAAKELARGTPFAQVAAKYDPNHSSESAARQVPVQHGRMGAGAFASMEDRLFRLRAGETLGPEKIAGVWWIICCTEKKAPVTTPFEAVADQCRIGAQLAKTRATTAAQVEADFEQFAKANPLLVLRESYTPAVMGKPRKLLHDKP